MQIIHYGHSFFVMTGLC